MDNKRQPDNPDSPNPDGDAQWEEQVDRESAVRQNKIDRLRIAESGTGEYDDEPKKKHRFLHFLAWMLLIVILTAGGAWAGWYFWLRHEAPNKPAANAAPSPVPPPVAEEVPTETYDSTPFMLQFDYAEGWVPAEGDNKLTLTSPVMPLKIVGVGTAATGKTKTQQGQVVITFQHKQTSLPAFTAGDAQAVLESALVEYEKPSQEQRGATYISFLNYASSGGKGIDGIYVSGDNGYLKDQLVSATGVIGGDPLIVVSFRSCNDSKCSTPGQPVTIDPKAWDDASFSGPIKALLRSISVR